MRKKLSETLASLGIPEKRIDWSLYKDANRSEKDIIKAMIEIDQALEQKVIVMGGMCANSFLLGHRPMRKASNDLDCILLDEQTIYSLHSLFSESLFQTENFGDLFLDYNGIPVGFDLEETHGWAIPKQFFDDALRFNFNYGGLNSISPEFLIALKARRSISKKKFYGKDAIDTANILIAPLYKSYLKEIDYDKAGYLMREHSLNSRNKLIEYLDFVRDKGADALKRDEKSVFDDCLLNLRNAIDNAFLE